MRETCFETLWVCNCCSLIDYYLYVIFIFILVWLPLHVLGHSTFHEKIFRLGLRWCHSVGILCICIFLCPWISIFPDPNMLVSNIWVAMPVNHNIYFCTTLGVGIASTCRRLVRVARAQRASHHLGEWRHAASKHLLGAARVHADVMMAVWIQS